MTDLGDTREGALAAGLAFEVFVWVAGADERIEPSEVAVFQRMLERRSWCKSKLAQVVLPAAQEAYSPLWSSFARKELSRDLGAVERGLWAAATLAPAPDFELFKRDLTRVAEAVARAARGMFGLGSSIDEEEQALVDLEGLFERVSESARRPTDPLSLGPAPRPKGEYLPTVQEIPVFTTAPQELKWTKGRIRLCCVEVTDETRDVKTLRFVGEPAVKFVYQPGQFLTLEVDIDGQRVKRSYSISSTPTRPGTLEITVKRVPGGLVSNWLHDNVAPGFRMNITGPSGRFACPAEAPPRILLLSAGSGITPVMSMARFLFDSDSQSEIIFLHSARSLDDVPFAEEVAWMGEQSPRFQPHLILTRPAPDKPWLGPTGRLTPKMILDLVPGYRQRVIYACGPTPFMDHAREVLLGLGFPMKSFHMESFGGSQGAGAPEKKKASSIGELLPTPMFVEPLPGPLVLPAHLKKLARPAARAAPAKLPKVIFARSEREVAHDGETSLLELAERMGVDIASACRAGVCGTCKVQLRSGEVKMQCSDGLSALDKSSGKVLSCVGIPAGEVVVDC